MRVPYANARWMDIQSESIMMMPSSSQATREYSRDLGAWQDGGENGG